MTTVLPVTYCVIVMVGQAATTHAGSANPGRMQNWER